MIDWRRRLLYLYKTKNGILLNDNAEILEVRCILCGESMAKKDGYWQCGGQDSLSTNPDILSDDCEHTNGLNGRCLGCGGLLNDARHDEESSLGAKTG